MKLSVHVPGDPQREDRPPVPMLQPILGVQPPSGDYPWSPESIYRRYGEQAGDLFQLTSLEQADLVVFPFDWVWVRGFNWYARDDKARRSRYRDLYLEVADSGKPVAGFFTGDRSCEKVSLPEITWFRHSAYRSRLSDGSGHSFPAFIEDFVDCYLDGELLLRQKQETPVVSFCGLSTKPDVSSWLKTLAYQADSLWRQNRLDVIPYLGEHLRSQALNCTEQSDKVEGNFIIRDRNLFIGGVDNAQKMELRQEFIKNVLGSDYVICCRGSGNFSFRLYETLCMGRIPIIVETDIALPFDQLIDWRKHAVWVGLDELDRLPEIVAAFHNRLSPSEFLDLQRENRRFWQEWLSPEGFYSNFHRFFLSPARD